MSAQKDIQDPKELEQKIEELNNRIDQLAHEGKYSEAEKANKELEETKKKLKETQKLLLQDRQAQEANDLKVAYSFLESQLKELWDQEERQFKLDSDKQRTAMEVCI